MNKQQPWWKEPTRKQWAAFSAAWVGWVLDAFDFTIYIVVAHEIMKEFDVPAVAVHGSLTLTLLVRLAGGSIAGWMADRWGRRLPLMLSLLWFAAFDAAIFFAPTFTWIIVFRTLFGFGMGAEWTAGTALAMESFPPRGRKFASGLLQAGWPVGFLLAAATAYFVVPAWGWRAMFLIAAVPALLVIPIRMFVPDEHAHGETKEVSKGAVRDLLVPSVLKMIVLGSLVMTLGFIVYYGMATPFVGLNLAAGATAESRALTERDRWLASRIGPVMRERGMLFVGLDVIGGYVTEINVTSPTGIREIEAKHGHDVGGMLIDAVLAKLAGR